MRDKLIAGNPPRGGSFIWQILSDSLTKYPEKEDPLEAPSINSSRGFLFLRVPGYLPKRRPPLPRELGFPAIKVSSCSQKLARTERGVAGLDPSTRGRSPVVLEVRFRSRALLKAEIQSEIVPSYLHYLGFCTV